MVLMLSIWRQVPYWTKGKCSTDVVLLFVYTDVFVCISQIYQNNSQKVMYIFVYFIVFLYLCTRFGICALNR